MTEMPPPPPGPDPDAQYAMPGYGAPAGGMPSAPGQWVGPPLAEWPQRALAALIDGAISAVPYYVLGLVSWFLGFVVGLGASLYLLYLAGTTGQSIGKKVIGIKLLREADGQVIGFGNAVVRAIAHVVDALPCGIGFLFPLWDAKKQTFADKIMQTVVVRA
jgi:uncharacterized RDD family membrane protein YckC